jgi:hypothetical protein
MLATGDYIALAGLPLLAYPPAIALTLWATIALVRR